MRDQRRKEWEGELPTGTHLKMVLPDVTISRKALDEVPSAKANHLLAATEIAVQHQLKMCIREVDGESVSVRDMRYGGLDEFFGPQEQQLVKELLQTLTRPSEAEMAHFKETLAHAREGGEWLWSGQILTGTTFSRLKDAQQEIEEKRYRRRKYERALDDDPTDQEEEELVEKLKACEEKIRTLEDQIEECQQAALEVSGHLPGSKVIRRSKEQIPEDATPALAAKEYQENLIRNTLDEIDGQAVSFADLRGTDLDEWLSPKEQHILITALTEELTSQDEGTQDFLDTVQMG